MIDGRFLTVLTLAGLTALQQLRGSRGIVRRARSTPVDEVLRTPRSAVRVSKERSGGYKVAIEIYGGSGGLFADLDYYETERKSALKKAEAISNFYRGLGIYANSSKDSGYEEVRASDPNSGVGPWRLWQTGPFESGDKTFVSLQIAVPDGGWKSLAVALPHASRRKAETWTSLIEVPSGGVELIFRGLLNPSGGDLFMRGGLHFAKAGRRVDLDTIAEELPVASAGSPNQGSRGVVRKTQDPTERWIHQMMTAYEAGQAAARALQIGGVFLGASPSADAAGFPRSEGDHRVDSLHRRFTDGYLDALKERGQVVLSAIDDRILRFEK